MLVKARKWSALRSWRRVYELRWVAKWQCLPVVDWDGTHHTVRAGPGSNRQRGE